MVGAIGYSPLGPPGYASGVWTILYSDSIVKRLQHYGAYLGTMILNAVLLLLLLK